MTESWFSNRKWPVLIFFFLFWFGLLSLTGTLTSGYHFTDDHGIFHEGQSVSGTTIGNELRVLKNEILHPRLRFRPTFQMHRRWVILALGDNFTAWSVYYACLAVTASFVLFLFMTGTGFSYLESLLFVFLTHLGPQAAVWWKLGANENIGMLFLALSLFFLGKSVHALRRRHLYSALFVLFALLTSWCKESFILVLPALIFWRVWLCSRQEKTTITGAIKQNLLTGGTLLLIFAAELLHITQNLDSTGVGYAGYEGFSIPLFFKTAARVLLTAQGWVLMPLLAIIAVMWRREPKKYLTDLLPPVILAALFVIPQVTLYMKSGMTERYLLPGILGLTLLMAVLMRCIRLDNPAKGFLCMPLSRAETAAILLLTAALLMQLRVTRYTAMAFARDGRYTNSWLQSINQSTRPEEPLLVITHMHRYYEHSISLKKYLAFRLLRKNTLFSPVSLDIKPTAHPYWKFLNRTFWLKFPDFSTTNDRDLESIRTVLVFPQLEQKFLHANASWFNPSGYDRYSNDGGFVSYYRKGTATDTKAQEEVGVKE